MKQITLLFFFLSFIFSASAVETEDEKRQDLFEKILQKRTEYIVSKIELTKEEKEAFVPLYREYQEKRMALYKSERIKSRGKELTEDDYRKMNESYIDEQLDKATLDRLYYEKFREILPESKIYKLLQAEKAYKNELLKQVENRGKNTNEK